MNKKTAFQILRFFIIYVVVIIFIGAIVCPILNNALDGSNLNTWHLTIIVIIISLSILFPVEFIHIKKINKEERLLELYKKLSNLKKNLRVLRRKPYSETRDILEKTTREEIERTRDLIKDLK